LKAYYIHIQHGRSPLSLSSNLPERKKKPVKFLAKTTYIFANILKRSQPPCQYYAVAEPKKDGLFIIRLRNDQGSFSRRV